MKKTVALHNLGCKVNAYELEAIQQLLENRGYEIVPFAPGADVYIINTCTVTNIADRKSRQMLHKAKKMNPDAVVVACGCYVQAAGEKLEEDTAIDLIIGNNKKKDLVDILENFLAEREDGGKPSDAECKSFLVDMTHNREYETLSISKTAEHTRAFLKVQDGCNQFCTYCIIPYARGRVRSRRQSDVVEEVKRLVEAGYQEVVLTGINLSVYFVVYNLSTLILAFLVGALYFGIMAVYGMSTQKDLTGWGPKLMGGLLALLIVSVFGMLFVGNFGIFDIVLCGIGLLVFMGFTAYDTQKLRSMYSYYGGDAAMLHKSSIIGALQLYLDYINIFLYVLRLLGRNRNN